MCVCEFRITCGDINYLGNYPVTVLYFSHEGRTGSKKAEWAALLVIDGATMAPNPIDCKAPLKWNWCCSTVAECGVDGWGRSLYLRHDLLPKISQSDMDEKPCLLLLRSYSRRATCNYGNGDFEGNSWPVRRSLVEAQQLKQVMGFLVASTLISWD